jgi:hypothetical protein
MPNKLFISDQRMLQLMEWAVANGMAANRGEYLDKIGFTRNNLNKVKKGIQSFQIEQILSACILTGASADYIFGLSNEMTRKKVKQPLELLKEAVIAIEHDMIKRR